MDEPTPAGPAGDPISKLVAEYQDPFPVGEACHNPEPHEAHQWTWTHPLEEKSLILQCKGHNRCGHAHPNYQGYYCVYPAGHLVFEESAFHRHYDPVIGNF